MLIVIGTIVSIYAVARLFQASFAPITPDDGHNANRRMAIYISSMFAIVGVGYFTNSLWQYAEDGSAKKSTTALPYRTPQAAP
ncbi:hypothetical protein [Fimbriiglobus ruber]|nr:hypothetical protein [Fimbriiglobus ruber]